jgi:nitroreductase
MTKIPDAFGLSPEQIKDVLATAGRAPSLHNSQPWRFQVTPHLIELHADPERRIPQADPDDRELRMACGAALFNLRLALHGHGIRPIVTILPDLARPDLLAVIRHGGRKAATPEQLRLLRAIPLRRTNRHPFSDEPVAPPAQYALRRAAIEEGAWLHLVDEPAGRTRLQQISVQAYRAQMADPDFRAELDRWTAAAPGRRDGIPATAGGPLSEPQDRWVLRDFRGGSGPARPPGKDFETEPLLAVLTAELSGALGDIHAGLALERILLTATAEGLAVSFLSHVVEVRQTREELRRLISETRPPQAVLRIGRGYPVAATPRREVPDLLDPETSQM